MKRLSILFIFLITCAGAMAQQVQVEKHSKTPLAYPEFRDGAITFTFGTT